MAKEQEQEKNKDLPEQHRGVEMPGYGDECDAPPLKEQNAPKQQEKKLYNFAGKDAMERGLSTNAGMTVSSGLGTTS